MATWKSPTPEPIRVSLLSGHYAEVGPDPTEVPDFFDEHLLAAGAVEATAKRRGRRPRPPTVEAADEPTGDQTFETEASLIVEMDDDDAL